MQTGWVQRWRAGVVYALIVGLVVAVLPSAASAVDLTPLTVVPDETGFGPLQQTLVSDYAGAAFFGTLTSRVYHDPVPASQVTFVYDLSVTLAVTQVVDLSMAATGLQDDLRIGEIIGGTNGIRHGRDDERSGSR